MLIKFLDTTDLPRLFIWDTTAQQAPDETSTPSTTTLPAQARSSRTTSVQTLLYQHPQFHHLAHLGTLSKANAFAPSPPPRLAPCKNNFTPPQTKQSQHTHPKAPKPRSTQQHYHQQTTTPLHISGAPKTNTNAILNISKQQFHQQPKTSTKQASNTASNHHQQTPKLIHQANKLKHIKAQYHHPTAVPIVAEW